MQVRAKTVRACVRVREEYLNKYNGQQNGAGKGEVHAPVRKQRPDKLAIIDQWGRVKEMNRNKNSTAEASQQEQVQERGGRRGYCAGATHT